MRSLIAVTIVCLTSTSAFAFVVDTDCESGTMCWMVSAPTARLRILAMTMSRRSGRLARPARTTVIAAQVPVALRGQAQRVSA